jgi:tRNA pseudouridine55 synthase
MRDLEFDLTMDGLLVIDKSAGPTSHDVVARVRRVLQERRIGHTGTLDPLATGVLPLVVGRATRLARFLSSDVKRYRATLRLGWSTDSGDAEGRPIGEVHAHVAVDRPAVEAALGGFRGTFMQQPPVFSAKKIDGVRSHALARRDIATAPLPAPVQVTVAALDLVALADDRLVLDVTCSAGFYVRSLAHDLGARLGVGAHLEALRRTASGDITLDQALPFAALETAEGTARAEAALIPLAAMLPGMPGVTLTEAGEKRARNGQTLQSDACAGPWPALAAGGYLRLLTRSGDLLGLASPGGSPGALHPAVVLV